MGKIRAPHYRIVVADSRTARDGRAIEEIGRYVPTENPSIIEINSERAQYWLGVGAQPTEQVAVLLKLTGDFQKSKGDKNAKNTVQVKEAKAEYVIDSKKKTVLVPKAEIKVAPKVEEAPAAEAAVVEDVVAEDVVAEAAAETVEAPAAEEVAVEEVAVAEEAPAAEEAAVVEEAPAAEEAAVVEEAAEEAAAPAEEA
jgi:small subunit ribosomal protein S16